MTRVRRLVVIVAVVALLGAACSRRALKAGEARLEVDRGSSVLAGEQGKPMAKTAGRTLHRGARVRVVEGGATLHLPGGASMALRPVSEVHLDARPLLVLGDALVSSGRDRLAVDAGDSSASVVGIARVTRRLGVAVATYRGTAAVETAGRSLDVRAPRQAAVPALGVLPAAADPITYDATDATGWPQRYLGPAVDLGRRLSSSVRALSASLRPGDGHTVGFYRLLLPDLDRQPLDQSLLGAVPGTRPDEGLVGATITLAGSDGDFASRWRNVFAFRAQGADWGLVALDQGVVDDPAVPSLLDAALGRAPLEFASGPAPVTTPATAPRRPAGATTTTAPPRSGATTTTSTTAPPRGPVAVPPTGTPGDPVTQPIVQPIVDTLNGLLGGS